MKQLISSGAVSWLTSLSLSHVNQSRGLVLIGLHPPPKQANDGAILCPEIFFIVCIYWPQNIEKSIHFQVSKMVTSYKAAKRVCIWFWRSSSFHLNFLQSSANPIEFSFVALLKDSNSLMKLEREFSGFDNYQIILNYGQAGAEFSDRHLSEMIIGQHRSTYLQQRVTPWWWW